MKKLKKSDFHAPIIVHKCKEKNEVRILEEYGLFTPEHTNEGEWEIISVNNVLKHCDTIQDAVDIINEYLSLQG